MQSQMLQELRYYYTAEIVERVHAAGIEVTHDYKARSGAIPLPATLTIELCERIGALGSGLSARLYSDYPFPWRTNGGPQGEFERRALESLRTNSNLPVVEQQAHKINGACGTVGAGVLCALAEAMEQAGKNGDLAMLSARLTELDD